MRPSATKEVVAEKEAQERVSDLAARVHRVASANARRRDGACVLGHLGGSGNTRRGRHAPITLHLRLVRSEARVARPHRQKVPRIPVSDHLDHRGVLTGHQPSRRGGRNHLTFQ